MIDQAVSAGLHVRASLQCAFGCFYEGRIPVRRIADIVGRFVDHDAHVLALADTTGMGSPPVVKGVLDAVLPLCDRLPLALHLHDTRGLGLVNLMAALRCGVSISTPPWPAWGDARLCLVQPVISPPKTLPTCLSAWELLPGSITARWGPFPARWRRFTRRCFPAGCTGWNRTFDRRLPQPLFRAPCSTDFDLPISGI